MTEGVFGTECCTGQSFLILVLEVIIVQLGMDALTSILAGTRQIAK